MKHKFKLTRLWAASLLLLFGFTTNAWAGKGFETNNAWSIKYYDGGSSDKWFTDGQTMGATVDLGTLTTFYLKGCWVKTWASENWTTENCTVYYWIDGGDAGSNYTLNYEKKYESKRHWQWEADGSFNEYNVIGKATNDGANPGVYTLKLKWNLDGTYAQSSECGVKFTYPGFSTTSASQTDFSAALYDTQEKEISFTQHYGTSLNKGNCSITGTNDGDFEVTGISETNVTVKFKPSTSTGTKTAILTITDAHSKTCTITLQGTATDPINGIAGVFNNWDATANPLVYSGNTAQTIIQLTASQTAYNFKVRVNSDWRGNTGTMTRDNCSGWKMSTDAGECKITADVTGDYIFIYDKSDNKLTVKYPSIVTFDANGHGTAPASQVIIYNGTASKPSDLSETGYTFGGWYENADCTGSQWNFNTAITSDKTLYAKWQEIMSTITIQTPLSTQGSIDIKGDKTLGITTSQQIMATPKAGYYLKEWQVSGAARVTDSKNTTTIVYTNGSGEAGTVQAVFEFRWVLRGCRNTEGDPLDGMPGWETTTNYFEFEANATQGTKTVTLYPNYEYRFIVYDKKSGKQQGWENQGTLKENDWQTLYKQNGAAILMNTAGYGEYTFSIKEETDQPVVKITNPASYQITMKPKTYANGAVSSGDGCQSFTAKTREAGQDFDVSDGKYVRKDGSVTFTATPKTGYTFAGFYSNEACTSQITEGVTNNTYTTTITTATSVYAKFTENMTPVTLYIGGEGTVKVGDVTHKSGDVFNVGVHTTVTFTVTPGTNYKFNGWTTSTGADFTIENNVLKGNGAGRTDGQILNANFGELDKIYYYNISGQPDNEYWHWISGKVFVYFKVNWDNNLGVNPQGCDCREMHRIGETDIYWAYIETHFALNQGIAFSDENMSGYDNFKGYHGVYRTDFNKDLNMYVPRASDSKNNTDYASNGYWMKYDPKASENVGYYLKRKDASSTPLGEFQAIADGSHISSVTVSVDSNTDQYFYIVSAGGENYGATDFNISNRSHTIEKGIQFKVTPNGVGDYTLKLTQGEGTLMSLEIVYPAENGDYRVIYNNGTKDHPSQAIKGGDKVSFFVKHNTGNFRIQQFTSGAWADKVTNISVPGEITSDGVYVFELANDGQSLGYVGAYTGNYYIRTDVAGGGWHNYQDNPGNLMTKGTIYGYEGSYDYAYTNWAGQNTNVKFTVANDYSYCISDSTVVSGDILGEGDDKDKLKTEGANIRFMWNSKTNDLKRDYIGGSNDDKKFLLIHGSDNAAATNKTKSKLYETADAASPIDNAKFHDDGNWIYSKEFYVEPGAYIALTAHFNDKTQFFYGAGNAETGAVTTYEQFVGGSGENRLKMKVIYNFKTNELVAGYIPDGETISTTIDLNSDLLWIRTQQGNATPINFSSTDVQIENIRKIYGVLEFCKDSMTNLYDGATKKPLTNSSYDRINYWISFPFDVKVSEIFGVDGYGEKWVIQYYNGELRAQKGWFKETDGFWEWLELDDIMYAGKGYTLNIDPDFFNDPTDDIWKNVEKKVAFYFPSAANYNVDVIKQQNVTTDIPAHEYYRSVPFANDPSKDHKNTDSYWNIIGTPAFQPTTISTAGGKQGPKAIYVWKQGKDGSNGYDVKETMTGFTFQPMRSYIVQYGGEVTWNAVSAIVAAAPYHYADDKNYTVDLEFYFGEKRDHTYINLSDNATKGFKLNEDVVKMTNSGEPNIYSYAEGYDVAYNEVPMANQTINLGVIARKNGSYTFAMPKDFSGKAVLVDLETGEATDLNLSNYTVELNKGTYNNRFQLLLEVEAKAPTNMNPTKGEWSADGKTKKLFINSNIYLINAGRIYNASGTKVK